MDTTSTILWRGARRLSRSLLLPGAAATTLLLADVRSQQEQGQAIDATRASLEKWVEARGLLDKEGRDWLLGKETLRDRIDLWQREITSLQSRIQQARNSIAEADKKRGELAVEDERRKATEAKLLQQVAALEQRTLELLPRLPDALREQIRPVSQLLPADPAGHKQRLDERYRNVLFVLKQVHKWNREITVKSEVRALPDGSTVEVTVLYVGIGQAYYAGGNGKVAGTDTATATGWVWTPANELAADISAAIAILKNERIAAFVRLPVQIL